MQLPTDTLVVMAMAMAAVVMALHVNDRENKDHNCCHHEDSKLLQRIFGACELLGDHLHHTDVEESAKSERVEKGLYELKDRVILS